jgi:hypothetical protein
MQRIAIEAAMSISRDIENESHDGSFLNNESMQALHELLAAPTPERADAGKDAARWKWLKTQSTVGEQWGIMKTPWSRWDAYADAAILAANKEPK